MWRHTLLCSCRQECVEQLLQNMFSGETTESCIINGIQVLLTLLEIRRPVWVWDVQSISKYVHVILSSSTFLWIAKWFIRICFMGLTCVWSVFMTGWMVWWMLRDSREVTLLTAPFCWPSNHTWYTSTSYFESHPRYINKDIIICGDLILASVAS